MIALTAGRCKRTLAVKEWGIRPGNCPLSDAGLAHGIVSGIIIGPNFRQAAAKLDCETKSLRWPGPFGSGFLSPQPPGVVGIGPVAASTPPLGQRKLALCLFGGPHRRARDARTRKSSHTP